MTPRDANDVIVLAMSVGGLLTAIWAWRGKVLQRIRNWRRTIKARKAATEAMVVSWPTVVEGMSRYTEQFKALGDGLGALGVQIKTGHAGFDARLDKQDQSLATILANTWAEMRLSPLARFVCDNEGRNLDVNPAYAEMMRTDEKQLQDYGYKNFFREPAYHAAFELAAKEHRYFDEKTRVTRGDGTSFIGRVTIRPFPDDPSKGDPWRWYGVLSVAEELT